MNKITLQRFSHGIVTFGKMNLDWAPSHQDIYTIELPWNNNEKGISCIPQGLYNCVPHNSPKHPDTYQLLYVPNRDSILIHPGNFACDINLQSGLHKSDTEGCILVGFGIEEKTPMITKSKSAMAFLREVIGKNNFCIEIKD